MLPIYLFCAGLGIPLVLLFALGGSDGEVDAGGLDVDVDAGGLEVDAGFDGDAGGFDADADAGVGDFTGLIRRIPVSSYAMLMAFFGGVGAVSTWVGVGAITAFVMAVLLGILAAGFNAALFGFLRANASDSSITDRQLEGRVATVSVPIEAGKRGRVWIDTGNERLQITAGSIGGDAEGEFVRGDQVVIVEMEDGIAKVMGIDPDLAN